MQKLYSEFPYEIYGERLIRKVLYQYGIRHTSREYADCVDAGAMAYMYCISRFAIIKCFHVEAYLNKVIKIFINCALIISNEDRYICREHNLKHIHLDNMNNINRF